MGHALDHLRFGVTELTPTLSSQPIAHQFSDSSSEEPNADTIISVRFVGGESVVLSRYGDPKWRLVGLPTNQVVSDRDVRFDSISSGWREPIKAILWRYMFRGLEGRKLPTARSISKLLSDARPFLEYLDRMAIRRFADVTAFTCLTYANRCKQHRQEQGGVSPGNLLKPSSLYHRLGVVETLYALSQYTDDVMTHPWPETSATHLSGLTGRGTGYRGGKTPLIPDDVFSVLFQKAWAQIENAEAILRVRDELEVLRQAVGERSKAEAAYVRHCGWSDKWEFNKAFLELRTACYIVVASVSGCRNHELAFVQLGACYSTEKANASGDAQKYWWMRSQSTKTGEGQTEWMVPEAAVRALSVMERWSTPYRVLLESEIEKRRQRNPKDPEIAEVQRHAKAVFLSLAPRSGNQVRTMTEKSWNKSLKEFAKVHNIQWTLATHQFRRKFANYAARSQFGDLRYLRSHFKHWSMDMTLGYALNESQEVALYAEIQLELDSVKEAVVNTWVSPDVALAGGYGKSITSWRGSHAITLFKDHRQMVRSLAQSTHIRSNGHAWCTADEGRGCPGNDLERTRCGVCSEAVIGVAHAPIYKGLQDHLEEVFTRNDIGDGGRKLVRRELDRCGGVLTVLGMQDAGADPA